MTQGAGRKNRSAGAFGSVDKRATGFRARYFGPDGRRYQAPTLFLTQKDARAWLALRQSEIVRKAWEPPEASAAPAAKLTFAAYADRWMTRRKLKVRTRQHYTWLLGHHLLPTFGTTPLRSITADAVVDWHAAYGTDTPTVVSHAYGLLRTILGTALTDNLIAANPVHIRGAGATKRKITIRPASLPELTKITQAMPENQQAMILLASWCALRFGELTELRRRDIDLDPDQQRGVIRVRRGVVRTDEGFVEGPPKSDAGIRDVAIPPHLVTAIQEHLANFVGPDPDELLFPASHGGHLAPSTLYRRFYAARDTAGRPDLRFHDLRHSGAVLAAQSGATLADLMQRLGHSTPQAAMRYQHAAAGRDQQLAERMSELAGA